MNTSLPMPVLASITQVLALAMFGPAVFAADKEGKTMGNRIEAKRQAYSIVDTDPKKRRAALSINGKNGKQKANSLYHYYSNSNNRASHLFPKMRRSGAKCREEDELH